MASRRARALPTRRLRRASQESVVPMAAPRSLKEADSFQVQPGKLLGPKVCDAVQAGMTSVLLRLTTSPIRERPLVKEERKKLTAGAEPAQKPFQGRLHRCRALMERPARCPAEPPEQPNERPEQRGMDQVGRLAGLHGSWW